MDVVVIRLALIILLVLYHSFCIYTGAWKVPYDSFHKIVGYDWIGMLSHQFRLQGMVFISGLLFGYNMTKKEKKELHFLPFILLKAKRILLPCLFFGLIYYLLFYDLSVGWTTIVYRIMNGCGHLWFLPMIFWCFIITYILAHYPPPAGKAADILHHIGRIMHVSRIESVIIPPVRTRKSWALLYILFNRFPIKTEPDIVSQRHMGASINRNSYLQHSICSLHAPKGMGQSRYFDNEYHTQRIIQHMHIAYLVKCHLHILQRVK